MTKFMNQITYPISSLVAGAQKITEILSDFDPELERIEIDYDTSAAKLIYGVTVTDEFLTRTKSTISLDRPLGCTLKAIQNKNLLHEYDILEVSDTEYKIPVKELDSSEEYRIIITGRASREILDDMIERDCYSKRKTRCRYQQSIVYNVGAVTWDDSEVVTVITSYLDSVSFDDKYLPRNIREVLPDSMDSYHSEAWTTPYELDEANNDPRAHIDALPDPIQNLINASTEDLSWWFSSEVLGDFIETDEKINYRDVILGESDLPLPLGFDVETRTEFGEQQGLIEGTVEFEKEEFWKETRQEFTEVN